MPDDKEHDHCSLCFTPITLEYFDARLMHQNKWAVMCPDCFDFFGAGLGDGKGYRITRIHGKWVRQQGGDEKGIRFT